VTKTSAFRLSTLIKCKSHAFTDTSFRSLSVIRSNAYLDVVSDIITTVHWP